MSRKLFANNSGVYQIRNLVNGKIYIGQSTRLVDRRYNHFRLLALGKHHTPHLQSAYNKYGAENFVFEVLVYCEPDSLDYFEQKSINELRPQYNSRLEATSNRGHKMSDETKRRISLSNMGHGVSVETRNKLSKALAGRKMPLEAVKKLAQRMMGHTMHKGRKWPAEVVEKRNNSIREHWKTHERVVSDETRAKMSASGMGKRTGETNNKAVLTTKKVIEIRRLHKNRVMTLDGIAEIFGVSQTTIVSICMRRTWKHIP